MLEGLEWISNISPTTIFIVIFLGFVLLITCYFIFKMYIRLRE